MEKGYYMLTLEDGEALLFIVAIHNKNGKGLLPANAAQRQAMVDSRNPQ